MGGLRVCGLLFTVALLLLTTSVAELEITEIMYAPPSGGKEYVEVFTGGYTNLSHYLVADETAHFGTKSNLTELQAHPSGYVLIVENGSNFTSVPASIYSVSTKIGSGLNNGGDTVFLFFPNGSLITAVNYTTLPPANNGSSLQLINGTWKAAPPTPGLPNQAPPELPLPETPKKNLILASALNGPLYVNVSSANLFALTIKNKENCSERDLVTVAYHITDAAGTRVHNATFTKEMGCTTRSGTGSFTPEKSGDFTVCGSVRESTVPEDDPDDNSICFSLSAVDSRTISCDLGISIAMEETLFYDEGEKITFTLKPTNSTFPFRIEYWIEDLFGKIVKAKVTTTNANQKSWTAQSPEQDRVYFLKAQLSPTCQDANTSDNTAEKMLIVFQNSLTPLSGTSSEKLSSITINELMPTEPRFGDLLQVKLDILKGTTSKYAITLWAESKGRKISAETKIHLREEDTEYALTLPVQLFPKCTASSQDAMLVVEGLGVRAEKPFTVDEEDGTFCSEEDSASNDVTGGQETAADSSVDFSFRLLPLPTSATAGKLLPVSVSLQGDAEPHAYEVWSYLYRGSKCYSCRDGALPREHLLQSGTLEPFAEKILIFQIPVDGDLEDGDYNLKFKLRKDEQKTLKELTETMRIEAPQPSQKEDAKSENQATSAFTGNSVRALAPDSSGMVVYESNTAKAQALTPMVLLVTIGLLALVLLRK